jgi:acetylglutamate kinase
MKTYVIKLGGAVCLQEETLEALAKGLKRLVDEGHLPIVVHGGGPQIDKAISELGEEVVKHKGLRRTSPEMMAVVKRELDNIGAQLAAALWDRGVNTVHVGSTNRVLAARTKAMPDGFDLQRVGTFEGIHVDDLVKDSPELSMHRSDKTAELQTTYRVPIVTPVGFDEHGPLNINADEAGAAIAAAVGAERLLLATDVDAILGAEKEPLRSIDEATAAALIMEGVAEGGMVPKLMSALSALEAGVSSVVVGRLGGDGYSVLIDETPREGTVVTVTTSPRKVFQMPDQEGLAEATQ